MATTTITYNGNIISESDQTIPVSVIYNGNTIATVGGGQSKTLNCSGLYMSTDVTVGSKILNCKDTKMASDVLIEVVNPITYLPVGGRIFYIHSDNGATYTFYNANKEVLPTQTVAGLANAVYYSIEGTKTADKFYVYDSTNGLATNMEWGAYNTNVGSSGNPPRINSIGSGKTNTTKCLSTSACFTPYTSGNTTIWTYLRDSINANSVGGCNDWFIGSNAELDKLRSSGLVDWYDSNNIWSSFEASSRVAYFWRYDSSNWSSYNKTIKMCVVPLRAF